MNQSIESAYQQCIAAMTPAERVARSVAMGQWAREQIARRILAEHGEIPEEKLKWMVAREVYSADPLVCEWIDGIIEDVSS